MESQKKASMEVLKLGRRLSLNRETLRALSEVELDGVSGGTSSGPTVICMEETVGTEDSCRTV